MEIFESDREFQLWRAVVGHRQLLLRSTKTEEHPTRIDVLFKPVVAMKLRTVLSGLRVREADKREAEAIASDAGEHEDPEFKIFVVESEGFNGYVIASLMTSCEDEGDYAAPSALLVG